MNSFYILLVVFAIVCTDLQTLIQIILSPLCDPNIDPILIDTIVSKDNYLYYIFENTVTVVDKSTETMEKVSELDVFFNISGTTYPAVKPPITISFTHLNGNSDRILTLINLKTNNYWNISLETNRVLGSDTLSDSWQKLFNETTIDVMNIDDSNGYVFYRNQLDVNRPLILGYHYEWKSDFVLNSTELRLVFLNSFKPSDTTIVTDIALVDNSFINQYLQIIDRDVLLNDENITSGVIFDNKIHFNANRYSVAVPTDINLVTLLTVSDFTDKFCSVSSKPVSTTTIPVHIPSPNTTAPDTNAPDTTPPDTTAPDTTPPNTTAPETISPDTTSPDTTLMKATPPGNPPEDIISEDPAVNPPVTTSTKSPSTHATKDKGKDREKDGSKGWNPLIVIALLVIAVAIIGLVLMFCLKSKSETREVSPQSAQVVEQHLIVDQQPESPQLVAQQTIVDQKPESPQVVPNQAVVVQTTETTQVVTTKTATDPKDLSNEPLIVRSDDGL